MHHSDKYTLAFAAAITLVCSLILGAIAVSLRPLQQTNVDAYKKLQVLKGLKVNTSKLNTKNILDFFSPQGYQKKFVEKITVNYQGTLTKINENDIKNITLENEMKKKEQERNYPLYIFYQSKDDKANGIVSAYCIPIYGYGLWSTCYGFLVLEGDAKTVKTIVYYDQKETPGLGGEIINPKWQAEFAGKSILDEKGKLRPIKVTKNPKPHEVQAISAATFTMQGVNQMIEDFLNIYEPYLKQKR